MAKLESEFWRESPGNSSPKKPCSFLWLWNPLLKLDLEPELLTVVALATEGRLSSGCAGNPMLSSPFLPLPGRKPGDSCAMSSFESLKKLITLAGTTEPFVPYNDGRVGDTAVGGFRDIDGILPPDVSSTASCLRWSLLNSFVCGYSKCEFFLVIGLCEGSFGGGAGGTVPGDISDSFSILLEAVS